MPIIKRYVFAVLLLCLFTGVKAQLYVQSGATLYIGGTITLHNEDIVRSSGAGAAISFEPGTNVIFTGNADNIINGHIDFLNMEIAKEGTHQVSLRDFNGELQRQLVFTSGLLNLNNQTLHIASTGMLINENENSRIIGSAGGVVQTTLTLNQPTAVNPGNIGVTITSTKNLGEVVISRTYMDPYPVSSNSIKRYYSIHFTDPANDNNLDATIRLSYLDAELNGTDETKLVHWKREEFSDAWMQPGSTANITRNTDENWVQLTHIASLSNWTLAESSVALPVEYTFFRVGCADNAPIINWQTATEINTDHFEIQRSVNGANWTTIATQKAAGQSRTLQDYSYTDRAQVSSGKVFYRILSVDKDGRKKYTEAKSSACGSTENWHAWPNPVQQQLYIRLTTEEAYKTSMQLFDNRGTLVRQWQKSLARGVNQFTVDMQDLAAGTYHLIIIRNDNREQKIAEIIKQ